MRIDVCDFSYIQDRMTEEPTFNGINISFQTTSVDIGNIRGSFVLTGQAFLNFYKEKQENGKSIQSLCEDLIKKVLELDKTQVDAFELEEYRRRAKEQEDRLNEIEGQNSELAQLVSKGNEA